MKTTAVIMAGGRGERFWPKSRNSCPKQFLSLTSDGETMIQKTVRRLSPLVEAEDIFIVTNSSYIGLVKEQLPQIPEENILAEPCARNTAPCIAFAAAVIEKKYGDAVMLVLPSDHLISYEKIYISTLTQLNVDAHNRIPTTSARLVRRLVRDYQFRGSSALKTLRQWPDVRKGEEQHIFPFQEDADVMFNSALIYELGVLKKYAKPLLEAVPPEVPEHIMARKLLDFCEYFDDILEEDEIPNNSLLREFIGKSVFFK